MNWLLLSVLIPIILVISIISLLWIVYLDFIKDHNEGFFKFLYVALLKNPICVLLKKPLEDKK